MSDLRSCFWSSSWTTKFHTPVLYLKLASDYPKVQTHAALTLVWLQASAGRTSASSAWTCGEAPGYKDPFRKCVNIDSAKSEASATWGYSFPGAEHLPWLSFIRFLSADFSNLSVVPIQRDIMMLPDEKPSAPGGLAQCLYFQTHWPLELRNFHSARRTGKQPAHVPTSTRSLGSQVSLWGQPPGTI